MNYNIIESLMINDIVVSRKSISYYVNSCNPFDTYENLDDDSIYLTPDSFIKVEDISLNKGINFNSTSIGINIDDIVRVRLYDNLILDYIKFIEDENSIRGFYKIMKSELNGNEISHTCISLLPAKQKRAYELYLNENIYSKSNKNTLIDTNVIFIKVICYLDELQKIFRLLFNEELL